RAYDLQRNIPSWMSGTAYVPYNSSATLEDRRMPSEMTIVIRSTSDEAQTTAMLREAVASLSHEVPVIEVKTMGAVVSDSVSTPRSTTILFAAFAGLALTLGIIGVYGVLSFLVSNRTQEIGIRMALGAQRRDVLRSVMGEGAKLSLAGIGLGMVGALALMRVSPGALSGVSAPAPPTFCRCPLRLALLVLSAC